MNLVFLECWRSGGDRFVSVLLAAGPSFVDDVSTVLVGLCVLDVVVLRLVLVSPPVRG